MLLDSLTDLNEYAWPNELRLARLLVARLSLLAKCRDALLEIGAGPHPVAQLLLERLARERVVGDRRADLALHRLHRRAAVGGDRLAGLLAPCHPPRGPYD